MMKEVLKELKEWSLLKKVKKFESKRKEYKALMEKIRCALDELNDLERLITICKGKISEEKEGNIQDVRSLFTLLEDEEILGISCLDILKEILENTEQNDLLHKVQEFEDRINREERFESQTGQAAACVTSVAGWIQARSVESVLVLAENLKRAITLVCNFRTVAGGFLTVNSGMALQKCSSRQDYQETFERVVLPSSNKLIEISNGSIRFVVEAEKLAALKELWDIYKDGTLQSRLQEFLVTDEIKQLANGEDIKVTVCIDEHEYKEAYFNLFLLHQAPNVEQEERAGRRPRRNSDSFLCLKPNENEMALKRLMEETEEKWRKEKEILELRITELEETLKAERTSNLNQTTTLGPPLERRRRNSDSDLYYKARNREDEQTENEPERAFEDGAVMDFDKRMFVENYLRNIPETPSMTTETSDSGITTHGLTSEIEMQDISGGDHRLCWKDLSEDVIRKLEARLRSDEAAWKQLLRSFGIDPHKFSSGIPEFSDIFGMFPDTPVKELREVFEALQLYDLINLLEEGKPRTARSLRTALPLQDIEKLRNPGDRPISYHSSVAVLIIEFEETCNTEGIEKFFKGLNLRSEVTVVSGRDVYERSMRFGYTSRKHLKEEVNKLRSTSLEVIQRWIFNQAVGRTSLPKYPSLCSQHFDADCFEDTALIRAGECQGETRFKISWNKVSKRFGAEPVLEEKSYEYLKDMLQAALHLAASGVKPAPRLKE
ncbi:uncharacterized protein LOC111345316 [Stylophora pistillata]|uniref:uncharacterized protein LOC111345316 n=1 Tax=Stylophora pistillata TaxID=50429 RepID=UPI000C043BCD|nr:uncharacterized protein LOC111345316 [Stylophora pistillata]